MDARHSLLYKLLVHPDGRNFAGWQVRTDGLFMGISIYSFDTSRYDRVTDFGGYPRWLKDGRRLLFTESGSSKVYLVDRTSRKVREITGPSSVVSLPADNRWIYFGQVNVESDIWLAKIE